MSIKKVNRVVMTDSILSEIDEKATKTELANTKAELENKISQVQQGIIYKQHVATYADIATTYPNPEEGWTVSVDDTNTVYRYDANTQTWQPISINTIPLATPTVDGKMSAADKAKLDTIEPGAQVNKTPQQMLADLKTVDGANSGLDADLLDGKHANDFALATHDHDGRYYTQTQLNTMLAGKSDVTHTHNLTVNGDVSGSVILDNTSKTLSLTLNNTGVTSGTYTKVTVDSKGRVTTGQSLSASDIPNLDWAKITTGKPTTLAGYGITDAIPSSQKGAANGVASLDSGAKVPTLQLPSASTSVAGIVQLNNTTNSTSTTQAATANAVKQANDNANNRVSKSGDTMTGTLVINKPNIHIQLQEGGVNKFHIESVSGELKFVETDVAERIKVTNSNFTYNGNTVWHAGNDGAGSGLDADTVDGKHFSDIQADAQTKANQAETNAKSYLDNQKGTPNGIAPLDANGKIPDSYISSAFVTQSQLGNAGYGDMTKSIYDTDNDGIVDRAEVADRVDWSNVQNKPTTFTPSSHTHNWSEINNKPTTLSGYGISDAVNSFSLHANGASTSYVKIAELTTNIGSGENSLILYVNGISDFGNNMPGVDILQVSTKGSVGLMAYRLIPSGSNDITYGYVNNGATGKTEIWLKRDAYNYGVNIIVANARNATYGNLLTQSTEPSGIVYVTKGSIALTTDNVSTASKLQTARTISLTGDATGSVSFDGSANVNIVTALSNTGVVSGIYTKVTVDSKGRITAGSTLSESDIPNLDWSKIYNKPLLINGVVSSTEPLNPSTNLIWIDTN